MVTERQDNKHMRHNRTPAASRLTTCTTRTPRRARSTTLRRARSCAPPSRCAPFPFCLSPRPRRRRSRLEAAAETAGLDEAAPAPQHTPHHQPTPSTHTVNPQQPQHNVINPRATTPRSSRTARRAPARPTRWRATSRARCAALSRAPSRTSSRRSRTTPSRVAGARYMYRILITQTGGG